jgi:mono/diheme cytochrome c family protein
MTRVPCRWAWLSCLGLVGLLAGCHKTGAPSPSVPSGGATASGDFDTESGPFAAGKKLFVANNCFRCHAINGVRGPAGGGGPPGPGPGGPPKGEGPPGRGMRGGPRGPDLGKVGADPEHTVAWITEHIRDAKAHKPDSRMPAFEGKISDEELRALAEYLASLK